MMLNEPVCLAIVVNAAYCFLLLVAQLILKIVFGKLRGVERQHLKVSMISQVARSLNWVDVNEIGEGVV